jgi:hypothetical protein
LTGPDGITAGDVPANHLGSNKSKVQVQVIKAGNAATGLKAKVKCQLKDVLNGTNAKVTTVAAGTCAGGPNDGLACSKVTDCQNAATKSKNYACVSGDELNCQLDGLAESNTDNSPACGGPCLAALFGGPPGAGCGTGGGTLCVVGTCAGGSVRDGQCCDITGVTDCPGGFCDGVGSPFVTTGDETGFFAPAFGGMAYLLCPFNFMLGFPVDVKNGSGQSQVDLALDPISVCVPDGDSIEFKGLFVHDNNSDPSDQALLGFHTTNTTPVHLKNPCPDCSLPLPGANTGLPTITGTAGVIGVIGVAGDL